MFWCENLIIVELKAVEHTTELHDATATYLKFSERYWPDAQFPFFATQRRHHASHQSGSGENLSFL
jgi:hypothetical protein